MKNIIEIKNLTKKYKDFIAIKDISLNFVKGETVAIIGDNGAGKTTLASLMAGLLEKTNGEISYNFENNRSAREAIGMQFQANAFPKGLSVKHLLDFFKATAGANIDVTKLERHIKAFDLASIMSKEANAMSGGQKQRLNIVIALLSDPDVIILDEVSTGLDIGVRYRMLEYIKSLKEEGKTIIIISHSVDEIDTLADRVIILEEGKVFKDEKASKLKKNGSISNFLSDYFTKGGKK